VTLTFESSGLIVKRLQTTVHADVVLINDAGLQQLVRAGLVAAGSAMPIATSQVGVAVRSGAPKPDISTAEAFTRTLLAARMVTYPDAALEGSSGVHLAAVMARLGIAAQMKARTIYPDPPGPGATTPGSLVATGKADIALHQMQELIAVQGIDMVGPVPDELQQTFTFSAAIVRGAVDVAAATALTEFLRTPESRTVILAKGMGLPVR
jgi:molybdate transport system substrate-binding protein